MANYIENFNGKLDWAMPFQRTGKYPLDRSNMFSSYADAVLYASGGADSRGLGGTSYVGQLIVVFENDIVTVYKINADKTIEALTSESGVNADILELTTKLNNEIAARKAVDGQTGQTYVANTDATHIKSATSLNDADIKLNNAITAETKARQDAINALDKTISKTNDNFDISITQTDGLFNTLTISDIHLTSGYTSVKYPEVNKNIFTSAKASDTLDVAIKTVDQNVATLVQEVLDNEVVVAAAITEIKESIGVDENLKYVKDSSATFISEATTFSEADSLLDIALTNEIANRQSAIDALDATVSSSTTNVGVTVVQTNGKLESVTLTQTDIASASALTAEIAARKAVDGQTGQTYANNNSTAYIKSATSLNDADIKLDAAISNLKITSATSTELTSLGTNVKEAYKLIDGNSTQHGSWIKIYKDSSLQEVYLGLSNDTINTTTGVITKNTVPSGQVAQSLNFKYQLTDGTYSLVKVDVSKFLAETEYADGLQVSNGVISVKKDSSSESFLSVSSSGVKLSGVQNAINTAINSLSGTVSSSTANVGVTVVQTKGKLESVTLTQSDIASASALTSEIAARKAVDGQTGQTYAANTGATHIKSATSLNDADIKLNNAITAETKARQDAIDDLNAIYTQLITIDSNGKATSNHIGYELFQINGKITGFSITEEDIASAYDLSQEIANRIAAIEALDSTKSGATTHVGVKVVETNGKLESVTVTESDIASASALASEIAARKAVDGQTGQTYVANTGATHIKSATSLNDADIKLNNAITAETKARQDAINAISGTTSGNGTHVDVTVVQKAGKITSVTIDESDIASASALTNLINWCAYMSGNTTSTNVTSIPTTKRLCIATISSSQTLGVNGSLAQGRELHIIVKNNANSRITITIPSTFKNLLDENLVIEAGKYGEINLVSDGTNIYYRGAS